MDMDKERRALLKKQDRDKGSLKPEIDVGVKDQLSEKSDVNRGVKNKFMEGYTDNLAANANYMGSSAANN